MERRDDQVIRGAKKVDKAAELDSESVVLRILRMENGVGVSEESPYKRWDIVEVELPCLGSRLNNISRETTDQWELITAKLARARKGPGSEIGYLERGVGAMPESVYAKGAEAVPGIDGGMTMIATCGAWRWIVGDLLLKAALALSAKTLAKILDSIRDRVYGASL